MHWQRAGAYGPLVELNEQREGEHVKLNVYSGEHYHQQTIREREAPGPFYFPPAASLITAGGRLLLALAEKCVADAGGVYLFCDTNSLCIVANEKGGSAPASGCCRYVCAPLETADCSCAASAINLPKLVSLCCRQHKLAYWAQRFMWRHFGSAKRLRFRLCRACLLRSDFLPCSQSPLHDLLHDRNQAFPQCGEPVFDFGRNDRILLAVD